MRNYEVHMNLSTSSSGWPVIVDVEADYIATMSKESYNGHGIGYDYTFLINDDDLGTIIVAVFPTDKVDYIVSEEIPDKVDDAIQDK